MSMQSKPVSGLCAASLMTVLAFAAGGCEDGIFEDAGEEVDEAVDDAGDAIEDAGDKIDDAVDDHKKNDAGEKTEDAVDDTKDKVDG